MKKNTKIIFDLDDLSDRWDPFDRLAEWKRRNPNGRVTLFAIPRRISPETLAKYAALEWVELGLHGYWHNRGECLYWTRERAAAHMKEWEDAGYARVFKAPGWLIQPEVYAAAADRGWLVADHVMNRQYWKKAGPLYVYNHRGPQWPYTPAHGHTHDVCGNGIDEAFDTFIFPPESTFHFITEAGPNVNQDAAIGR